MKKKIYFAQAVDGINEEQITKNYEHAKDKFKKINVEVISTYHILNNNLGKENFDIKTKSKYIVEKDIELLQKCDLLLVDLSLDDHFYIGCIFEIAYAYYVRKKPIIVICNPRIASRYWLVHHTDIVCSSLNEAVKAVEILIKNTE